MVTLDFYFGMLDELIATGRDRSGCERGDVHQHTTSRLFGEAVQFVAQHGALLDRMKIVLEMTDAELGAHVMERRNRNRIKPIHGHGDRLLFNQACEKYSGVTLVPIEFGGLYGEWKQ